MQWMRGEVTAEAWRLLCVLFLRFSALSADPVRAIGRERRGFLLFRVKEHAAIRPKRRAIGSPTRRKSMLAWCVPSVPLLAGLPVQAVARTAFWIVALI